MTRPKKCRRIRGMPAATYFKPAGIPIRQLEEVLLNGEEAEALRLKDIDGLDQATGGERMNVSRPTFQRILQAARHKVADAVLNGKAIRIEGGNYEISTTDTACGRHRHGRFGGHGCRREPETINANNYIRSKSMKIVISASGNNLEAAVDPRFGRCPGFIIIDPETMAFETLDNSANAGGGGAGIATAQMIAGSGVKAVLTGNCGPNAFQVLEANGIEVVTGVSGTVAEAVKNYQAGAFQASNEANVGDHFGTGGGK